MKKLLAGILKLPAWQRQHKDTAKGHCLGATRWMLGQEGIELPWLPNDTAYQCFEELIKNPSKYGLVQIHHDPANNLQDPCIVFFGPQVGDGCGHVGILHAGTIYSAVNYPMTPKFAQALVGAFVPA